jgi:hypothetical protein
MIGMHLFPGAMKQSTFIRTEMYLDRKHSIVTGVHYYSLVIMHDHACLYAYKLSLKQAKLV